AHRQAPARRARDSRRADCAGGGARARVFVRRRDRSKGCRVSPRRRTSRTEPVKAWPYPRYAAHRGAGKLAPENTLVAMRLGQTYGYRMVEFDVKLSGDGVPFLLHDDTLDR